jgi:AmiR/NasT family two-component response regulator
MATNRIGDQEAFNLLRDASSRLNLRLALVARRLVEQHNDDAPDAG